jgi:alcohol dehydrogenase class IV
VTVFSDIDPDPSYEMVLAGVARLDQSKADAILAVGGGSPMDCAKAMLLSHANACHPKKLTTLWLYAAPRRKGLPFYAIPTTAGSGSEATIAAVVSDAQAQSKRTLIDPKLAPSMVALDPALMTGLPPFITAPTGMDALTHAIEAYISTMANAETDELALLAAVGVLRHLPTAFSDGMNIQAREGMAIASYMAGLAFTRAGVGYVHAIAHQLGGLYHMPHGLINAIVMPYVLDYSKSHCVARLAQLARAAGVGQIRGSDALIADALIAHIREMNTTMGIPDKVKDLKRSDFDKIIERAFAEAHGTYGVPRYLDRHSATVLLTQLLPASQLSSNH